MTQASCRIALELPSGIMSALRKGSAEEAEEIKTAAVVQWHAEGRISQAKGAEIPGVSRTGFLDELYRRKVPALLGGRGPIAGGNGVPAVDCKHFLPYLPVARRWSKMACAPLPGFTICS
uniref:Predicted antitoxin, contains HTH domain n=1 Tax=Candidatus Kentrum sp. FW TaxID=2126338 RepID=A0A450TPV2_9GAMM|nr:MAG: Predicted antitoxin, contains HTH domain [Candidatus Kentron sp. FW]